MTNTTNILAKKKRGRKRKFEEATKVFAVRLPISRYEEIKSLILNYLNRTGDAN